MKKDNKKIKKPSYIISDIIIVFSMLLGLAMLLYPNVANKINESVNEKAINQYKQELLTLDNSQYEAMLQTVKDYNSELFKRAPYIGALTAEERETYEKLLDVTGNGIMGYIEIEKPHINLAIYHGTDESVLQTGAGHLEASSLPMYGESVHTVLSGHSGLPSARLFTDLDQLKIGDTFTLHILWETLTYQVEKIQRVHPDEINDLVIEEGQELCTLMTCTPYGINTHRLVITGRRIETPVEPVEKTEPASIERVITSKWNRWFIFLPAAIFACTIVMAVVVHKRRKKKKQIMNDNQ